MATAARRLDPRVEDFRRAVLTQQTYAECRPKIVHYLSMEYLMGRLVENNLIATELREVAAPALAEMGLDLDRLVEEEPDPGPGNGGLGRLGACFIESLATFDYPAFGHGLCHDCRLSSLST